MKDSQILLFLILAIIFWLFWRWILAEEPSAKPAEPLTGKEAIRRGTPEAEKTRQEAEAHRLRETQRLERDASIREQAAEAERHRQAAEAEVRRLAEAKRLEREASIREQAAVAERKRQEAEAETRRLAEAERARHKAEVDQARHIVERERASVLSSPIASDILRDMRDFLRAGQFFGDEHSPLAYVGYRVGKTKGLPVQDRRRRLRACFQIEIPRELAGKYQAWGKPVSRRRYDAMCQHITMLADMRRERRNYEIAVADWETDVHWFKAEYSKLALMLTRMKI